MKGKYNDVKEFANSCVPYERAQILQDRKKLEEFQKRFIPFTLFLSRGFSLIITSLAESDSLIAPLEKDDNFSDKKWIIAEKENLAKQKIKNTIVRRYQEDELKRFLEVKRKQENEQLSALHEKLSIMYKMYAPKKSLFLFIYYYARLGQSINFLVLDSLRMNFDHIA